MESLALVFSSGWASGVNAYLVVLVLGIADRVGDFADIPDALGRWEVLAVAAFMYAMEFVADKIPYVDSTWDVISTAIRPTVGAIVGVLIAGDADSLSQAAGAVVGGGTALASHAVKAGSRLAVNSSPNRSPTSGSASSRTSPSSESSGSPSSTRSLPRPSPPSSWRRAWSSSTSSPG